LFKFCTIVEFIGGLSASELSSSSDTDLLDLSLEELLLLNAVEA